MYVFLKYAHITFALISGGFFFIRGVWMLRNPSWLAKRWVRVLPHVNDTLLLACAIGLMLHIEQYPFVDGWLTAKVLALLLYIISGTIALKRVKTKAIRIMAFGFALFCYLYMLSVALNHHPLGAFG